MTNKTYIASLTDEQLVALWNDIDNRRVKSGRNKGHVTIKAAKLGDEILAEQIRRRQAREQAQFEQLEKEAAAVRRVHPYGTVANEVAREADLLLDSARANA